MTAGKPVAEPDVSAHLAYAALEQRFTELAASPRDAGRVSLVVVRERHGLRATLEEGELTPEGGLEGDLWARAPERKSGQQIAVMETRIAELIGNGQPLTLYGDNLLLDLDLSPENLPIGSQVNIGTATLVVTPEPHEGCALFRARFGTDALRFLSGRPRRARSLRGLYLRVMEAGRVRPGDSVVVSSRG